MTDKTRNEHIRHLIDNEWRLAARPVRKHLHSQAALMYTALEGMARHEYLSGDWCAHNELFCQSAKRIAEYVGQAGQKAIADRMLLRIARPQGVEL